MRLLNKLERKFGKYAIKNLIMYIVIMNAIVFMISYSGQTDIVSRLALVPSLVLKGEIWRLVTYIFIPSNFSIIWIIFVLYFTYLIGSGLEHEWGSFKFNIYYFIGMLGTTIAAFISGIGSTGDYLNLSLFLAFAYVYPDFEILLFFILPIKMKYFGWLDVIFLAFSFVSGGIPERLAIIAALINFILFFGMDIINYVRNRGKAYNNRYRYESRKIEKRDTYHKCTVCGITEKDDKNMEFRYCSGCEGHYEYCMNHLKQHEHKTKVIEVDFTKKQ